MRIRIFGIVAALVVLASPCARAGEPKQTTPAPTTTPAPPTVAPLTTTSVVSPLAPDTVATLRRIASTASESCLVVNSGAEVLFEANPDIPLTPASVTKILTAIAAVDILGADTAFDTTVRSDSPVIDGTVAGDVWLVGGGDPVLGTAEWAAQLSTQPALVTPLEALADRFVARGVRGVAGRVLADESRYDSLRYPPAMPGRLIADGEIGPLSALIVNDGFERWGHPGRAFADPAVGAVRLFTRLLRDRGVVVRGGIGTDSGAEGTVLAEVSSPTVATLVEAMLRDSDNGTAELLVKEMGRVRFGEGSTAAGVLALSDALATRGLAVGEGIVLHDGSGLSESQKVTCRLLASALAAPHPGLAGLPVAGRTGTLRMRFRGSPAEERLRAKTGSLEGVSALAGVVEDAARRRLSFAYVVNGLPEATTARADQDALASALASNR